MREPTSRHQRIAAAAVNAHLQGHSSECAIALYTLSIVADHAAREAGRKTDLFGSLFEYSAVLPTGARCLWVENHSGSIYCASNPYSERTHELQETLPFPGAFDVAVDMGPQFNRMRYRA